MVKNKKRKVNDKRHHRQDDDIPSFSSQFLPRADNDKHQTNNNNSNNKKNKKTKHHLPPKKKAKNSNQNHEQMNHFNKSVSSSSPPTHQQKHQQQEKTPYPPPFPSNLPLPPKQYGFLRDVEPYRDSYKTALETSYQGLAVDLPSTSSSSSSDFFPHEVIKSSLEKMDQSNLFFRTDVTQPFGLGTKCAKTYVTRCLLGEVGTTYKYLGLRMFAHPWDGSGIHIHEDNDDHNKQNEICKAVQTIGKLNNTLKHRTSCHLDDLYNKRCQKIRRGRATFDVALINKMIKSDDLKEEPTTKQGKCAVSWHADSCLEHYSTIAVYHTIFRDDKDGDEEDEDEEKGDEKKSGGWSVALRVAHDSEGPQASKRRDTDIESSVVTDTPYIAASLPSGSAYYLLDDFNHHHQHAVLNISKEKNPGVRFSSTHRLLREGHNVRHMMERCKSSCSNFHKKGCKVWRSEQLLLYDLESEWIRQFYVQGRSHRENLWKSWKEPICSLLGYWSQLENRTKQTIDLLRHAAEERCGYSGITGGDNKSATAAAKSSTDSSGTLIPSRSERKMRDKRKKAASSVEDILKRSGGGVTIDSADQIIYEPLATLLEERATMRQLWKKREKDHVFRRMDEEDRPLPVPFSFESNAEEIMAQKKKGASEEMGYSNLGGSPEQLRSLANNLRQWGKAYVSCNASDLPVVGMDSMVGVASNNNNNKDLSSDNLTKNNLGEKEQFLSSESEVASPSIKNDKSIDATVKKNRKRKKYQRGESKEGEIPVKHQKATFKKKKKRF